MVVAHKDKMLISIAFVLLRTICVFAVVIVDKLITNTYIMETLLIILAIALKVAIIIGLAYLIWRWGYTKGIKKKEINRPDNR